MILGIAATISIFFGSLYGVYLAIIGLVLGIATKNKNKYKIIGIILNAGILVFLIINIIFYIRGLQYLLTP